MRRIAVAHLFLLFLLPAPARGQAPSRLVIDVPGSGAAARFGQMVAAAGDLNGDGRPDFAVGSPAWGPSGSDSTGCVLIWFGGRDLQGTPDVVLTGSKRGGRFGSSIAGVGDVNGDGFDDLVVGAPGYDLGDFTRFGSGRGYVFFGGSNFDAVPDRILDPPNLGPNGRPRQMATGVAGLGDTDGDGFPDWAMTFEATANLPRGGACLYHGSRALASTPAFLAVNNSGQHPVIAAAGDFDGDGLADLAMGAPIANGTTTTTNVVSVFTGLLGSGSVTPFSWVTSTANGFGAALAAADVNGDGLSDLLIGQPVPGGSSQVRVWYGTRLPGSFNVPSMPLLYAFGSAPDSFGCSLAVGRVDGTGQLDLVVGASGDRNGGPGAGAAYVYRLGVTGGGEPMATPVAHVFGAPGDALGSRVAVPGDVDGNGVADLLLGMPMRPAAGGAQVLTLSPLSLVSPQAGEWPAGGTADVVWRGRAPARIDLSLDAGATWSTLSDGAGGLDENRIAVPVPDTVSGRCLVRISQTGAPLDVLHVDRSDATFSIVRPAHAWAAALDSAPERATTADDGRLGAALATGDFGLGTTALVIGAPLADGAGPNAGRVWVEPAGDPGHARRFEGDRGGESFGTAVAVGGDGDGDGHGDLLVGAPERAGPDGRTGGVSLISGGEPAGAPLRFFGSQVGESFGASVVWIGDLDADGRAEFAVGSPWFVPSSPRHGGGRVQIFRGGSAPAVRLELDAPSGLSNFGRALAVLDLDGDGRGDLAVSALGSDGSGVVLVWYGAALDTVADLVLRGGSGDDRFGESLAAAGDLNGDGYPDLLIGAPGAGGTGRVFVLNGGAQPAARPAHEYRGVEPGEDFGAAVAGAGDLNGDGRDDFVAGAPLAGGGRGAVRVCFGGSDLVAGATWSGPSAGGRFGAALAGGSAGTFFAAAPLDESAGGSDGRVDRVSVARYVLDAPAAGARWFAGASETIRWRGGESADVALSLDAGRTWTDLATHVIADPEHPLVVAAPSTVTDSALVRVRPADSAVPGVIFRSLAITHATEVQRFTFALETDGIRLTWATAPGLGPGGWSAYRIDRDGDPPVTAGPARIEAGELLVPDFTRGATYVLLGIDGNGAATELGRLTVPAPPRRLTAWPLPNAGGDVQLSVFPPVDATGGAPKDFSLCVFDLHGRLVSVLAAGRVATRAGEIRTAWNRRSAGGAIAGPGVYFLRAEAPAEGFRLDRRIVLLE